MLVSSMANDTPVEHVLRGHKATLKFTANGLHHQPQREFAKEMQTDHLREARRGKHRTAPPQPAERHPQERAAEVRLHAGLLRRGGLRDGRAELPPAQVHGVGQGEAESGGIVNRRHFMGLAAAANAVAQDVAGRIEGPPRFINKKTGAHPFRARPVAQPPAHLRHHPRHGEPGPPPPHAHHAPRDGPAGHARAVQRFGGLQQRLLRQPAVRARARHALATGRYTYITANGERAHDGHETILRPTDVIFQEYLKATGYRTKHAGKGHLGTQKFMDAFDENDNAWDRWAPPIYDDELYLARLRRLGVKQQRYRKEIRGLAAGPQDAAGVAGRLGRAERRPAVSARGAVHALPGGAGDRQAGRRAGGEAGRCICNWTSSTRTSRSAFRRAWRSASAHLRAGHRAAREL